MTKDRFAFSKLVVADLDRSASFYSEMFGLSERHRSGSDVAGRRYSEVVYLPTHAGGPDFILRRYDDKSTPSVDEAVLGFLVEDVEETLAKAPGAGGTVVQQPVSQPEHNCRVAYVTDPEGHLVEVSELIDKHGLGSEKY